MNDQDRSEWVDNEESLYFWWRQTRQSKAAFIRENRAAVTEVIREILDREPAR